MSKKTLGFIIGLLVLTAILLFIALKTSGPQQTPQGKTPTTPTPTPIVDTLLQLSPDPVIVAPGTSGSVEVMISTGKNEVAGIQLELAYDPKSITNFVVKSGGLTQNWMPLTQINQVNQTTGRATFAIVKSPAQAALKGQGMIATITFSTIINPSSPSTKINVLPKSEIGDLNMRVSAPSALKEATGTTVLIQSSAPSSQSLPQ